MTPSSTNKQEKSTLLDNVGALYRHINITGDLDLINLDWFNCAKIPKNVL